MTKSGHNFYGGLYSFPVAGPIPDPPFGHTWLGLMELALACAKNAGKLEDVPVGALVVAPNGEILARGCNYVERGYNPAGHAEILAITKAAKQYGSPRLPGAILVTTLEPCLMCVGAIAHSRLSGVVYGAGDARAGALHSAADMADLPLAGRVFWHMGGILGEKCRDLLTNFFTQRRS